MRAGLLLLILGSTAARAQSGLRVVAGGLELTHEYGVLFGFPLGEGPFSLEGQVGPGGAGGSLAFAWPFGPRDSRDARDQGLMWFVSAGLGPYFRSSSPGAPVGGVAAMIGGLRLVTGGGDRFRFATEGGLTLEAGLGFFQTIATAGPGGEKRGTAGRLAIGWQF